MQLLNTLASGVKGAESGTAAVYARGTSTRATYYTNFEGQTSVSPTSDISLDSNGSAVLYVDQIVDVVCKDSSGSIVRTFTEGGGGGSVDVVSQSFTGVDYETGASAASKPVTLNDVLDLWKDSAGTLDFQVIKAGSATNLQDAFSADAFVVVTDSAYGAVGDGVTDDTSAIQAAVDAADADGKGIVFLPNGTYYTTDTIDCKGRFLLGAGKPLVDAGSDKGTIITFDAATDSDDCLVDPAVLDGLQLYPISASYIGNLVHYNTSSLSAVIRNCTIGGASAVAASGSDMVEGASGQTVHIQNTDFYATYNGDMLSGGASFNATVCTFTQAVSTWSTNMVALGDKGAAVGCLFQVSSSTSSGTPVCCRADGDGARVVGNLFVMDNALSAGIAIKTSASSSDRNAVVGNTFDDNFPQFVDHGRWNGNAIPVGTRTYQEVNNTATTVAVDVHKYRIIAITQSTETSLTVSASTSPGFSDVGYGEQVTIMVKANGVDVALDFESTQFEGEYISGGPSLTVNDGNVAVFHFVMTGSVGTTRMLQTAAALEYAL